MKQLWQENKGSISLFATISIITLLMILFLSVNIGNIFAKKNLVQNTADSIAPALLNHVIEKIDPDNTVSGTPDSVAQTMLLSLKPDGASASPLEGGSYTITFGVYDWDNETFTAFTGEQKTNPDPALITQAGDLAVIFDLQYNALLAGKLLDFDGITLKGQSMQSTTYFGELEDDPPTPSASCCCTLAGGILMGPMCMTMKQLTYLRCMIDELKDTGIIATFIHMMQCWFEDIQTIIEKIKESIEKVDQAIIDAHDWVSEDNRQTI